MPYGVNRSEFEYKVFQAFLYFASNCSQKKIPQPAECFLVELVVATYEYLSGKKMSYHDFRQFQELGFPNPRQPRANGLVAQALTEHTFKINPALEEALLNLTELKFRHDRGEKWYESALGFYYGNTRMGRPTNESVFTPSAEFIEVIRNNVIPKLDGDTPKHCRLIGEKMQKYVDRDVAYINQHFRW